MKRTVAIWIACVLAIIAWSNALEARRQARFDQILMETRVEKLDALLGSIIPGSGVPDSVGTVTITADRINLPGFHGWASATGFADGLGLTDAQHPSRLMDQSLVVQLKEHRRAYAISFEGTSHLQGNSSLTSTNANGVPGFDSDNRSKTDEQLRIDGWSRIRGYTLRGYDRHGHLIVTKTWDQSNVR